MPVTRVISTPRHPARMWPVAVHAPLVVFLTVSVLVTDDRSLTWTRLSEALLEVAGLPLSFVVGAVMAIVVAPLVDQTSANVDWLFDAGLIACAWANVVVVAWLTRRGVRARALVEMIAMVAAGVGIWAALLSWAPEADYSLLPSVAAVLVVLVTVFVISFYRSPVVAGVLVGGGAYLAVVTHVALNSAFVLFLAVPLAVLGGAGVAGAAVAGRVLARRRAITTTPSSL